MHDSITILRSKGPILTKRWLADGTIKGYDRAKHFSVETRAVAGIRDLSALLVEIERQPTAVVIRGEPLPGIDLDYTERKLTAFAERPRHWLALDIDSYVPVLADPTTEPALAIDEFVQTQLPPEFRRATYHWQLTSSAGKPGAEEVLRCRLWYWLDQPRSQDDLEAWARALALPVDVTVFRTVQVIYTAAPVIEDGARCPVVQRHGLYVGQTDVVAFQMPDIQDAPRSAKGRGEMVDPTEKPGLIGLFCRLYPPQRVIDEDLVEGAFEWQGEGARINWLTSRSGAAGGVCITDDELHFYCSHNEDPFEGRACNAWDFVRVHRFGEMDDSVDADAVAWLMSQGGMPSHVAMKEFVLGLEDVAAEIAASRAEEATEEAKEREEQEAAEEQRRLKRLAHIETLRARVLECQDVEALKALVRDVIAPDTHADDTDRSGALTVAVQARFAALGSPQRRDDVRRMLRPPVATGGSAGGPDWLEDWVFVTLTDRFFNLETKATVTKLGFDAINNRHMPLANDGLHHESAQDYALNVWHVPHVDTTIYAPGQPRVFTMLKRTWANEFREDSVPQAGPGGEAAIRMVQAHLQRLLPDQRERDLLLSWMAFNARHPGRKIRWAPYLHGPQGTGKTFIAVVMGLVLGESNCRVLAGTNLMGQFNGWAAGHALVTIEEVYQAGHLYETEEKLKALVSNDTVDVRRMRTDPFNAPNFTNYLLLSNHPDGLPFDEGDRRYMVLHAALTTEEAKALAAEGYFDTLFDTCRAAAPGLRRWLTEEVQMHPEFDPNGRAPDTLAKTQAIEAAKSDADMILEDLLRGRNAVTTSFVVRALEARGVSDMKTRTLSRMLTRRGFSFLKSMWLEGGTRRVYVRGGWAPASDDEVKEALPSIANDFPEDTE